MKKAIVILVNGEVLSDKVSSTIDSQRDKAHELAAALLPIFKSDLRVAILHGNKPQVGFVLYRSELASHILHSVPLDVCGADTQGATGYMLVQALHNVLREHDLQRPVMSIITQTIVDADDPQIDQPTKAIGPYFDRDKAEQHRQSRGWHMILEPGRGYRRAVSSPKPIEIVEMEGIKQLVANDTIVIAAGGGGIPVVRTGSGSLRGVEAVVDTDCVSCIMAGALHASTLLMVIDRDDKFAMMGLSTEHSVYLSRADLNTFLSSASFESQSVEAKLQATARFLNDGGEQVIITTLRRLPATLAGKAGLHIGAAQPAMARFG